jgi:hypothetical protein
VEKRKKKPRISSLSCAPVEKHLHEGFAEPQVPPLRFPRFPVNLDGVGGPHAPFLKRKAHTRPCIALRGRKSGFAPVGMTRKGQRFHREWMPDRGFFITLRGPQAHDSSGRSEAQWRDLRSLFFGYHFPTSAHSPGISPIAAGYSRTRMLYRSG